MVTASVTRSVNCFTDEEEKAANLIGIVPFRLETRIRELGGKFESAPNWQEFSVRDGQLITGQNPNSAALVAKEVVLALRNSTVGKQTSSSSIN